MGQPKKLSHRERAIRDEQVKLAPILRELHRVQQTLYTTDDPGTFRWAALDILTTLRRQFPPSPAIYRCTDRALDVACQAQMIRNMRM